MLVVGVVLLLAGALVAAVNRAHPWPTLGLVVAVVGLALIAWAVLSPAV